MSDDHYTCNRCGMANNEVQEMTNCGQSWRFVVSCEVCGIAASGATLEEARQKFKDGDCDLDAEPS